MKNISIMGCLLSSSNLGCSALTYSIINLLEKISYDIKETFTYTLYEHYYDEKRYKKMCDELGIDFERVRYSPIGCTDIKQIKRYIWRFSKTRTMIKNIKKSNIVIDLTQGDSFTDIYGLERFNELTDVKLEVEKLGVPLILGPQTFGPFHNNNVKIKAKKAIENATLVIPRDEVSQKCIESLCHIETYLATDLAFALPYKKVKIESEKIKVGLNPSGLLFSKKNEATETNFELTVDYDKYIDTLISIISNDERYELHLIPHVGNDAVPYFKNRKNVICHDAFTTPIQAKDIISSMDIFVGSRMHATIAAFSAGVATIPVAYSRKFSGLFNSLGYDNIVELNGLDTNEAIERTMKLIENYKIINEQVLEGMKQVKRINESLSSKLKTYLLD